MASIYPGFADAILSIVNIFSIGGITDWNYAAPSTLGSLNNDGALTIDVVNTRSGSIFRRSTLDARIPSLVISAVFNAEWIFIGPKDVAIAARGVLFKTSINRAYRIAGQPETDLEMCIAPLEPCALPE